MILNIILGLSFTIFLPGYLLSLILFKKLEIVERLCISFGLSVAIVVFLGFFLTGIGYLLNIKGITALTVWFFLLNICIILILVIIGRNIGRKQ